MQQAAKLQYRKKQPAQCNFCNITIRCVQACGALSFEASPIVEMPGGMVHCVEKCATRLNRPCAICALSSGGSHSG